MNVIYKYTLRVPDGEKTFDIPGLIRKVVMVKCLQSGIVTFWADITLHPASDDGPETFKIVGTGEAYNETRWAHVGSCLDGAFVWHLLQRI